MTNPSSEPSSDGFAAGLKVFFTALLRLLVILLAAALIGGAIYLGFRYVYPRYLAPVAEHTNQIEDLGTRLSAQSTQSANQYATAAARIGALESQHAADAEQLADLEGRLASAEKTLTDQQRLLDQLETLQSKVNTLNTTLEKAQSLTADELDRLSRQAKLLQVMQYFTRGRLYLIQNNLGLAQADLQSARDRLAEMKSTLPEAQQSAAAFAVQQMDLALSNLPEYPVLAAGQLDVVWDLLLMDMPADAAPAAAAGEIVQTACPSGDCTIKPTPTITGTPTPYTATVTRTPWVTATPVTRASSTPTPVH
ncbi:MAG: hypothetical protein ABFD44_08970 [Anaerolineaceae bacterium]